MTSWGAAGDILRGQAVPQHTHSHTRHRPSGQIEHADRDRAALQHAHVPHTGASRAVGMAQSQGEPSARAPLAFVALALAPHRATPPAPPSHPDYSHTHNHPPTPHTHTSHLHRHAIVMAVPPPRMPQFRRERAGGDVPHPREYDCTCTRTPAARGEIPPPSRRGLAQ